MVDALVEFDLVFSMAFSAALVDGLGDEGVEV